MSYPYVCKLDSTGAFQWVQNLTFTHQIWPFSGNWAVFNEVVAGPSGVYATVLGYGFVNLDPKGGIDTLETTEKGIIQKYDLNGNYQWTKVIGELDTNIVTSPYSPDLSFIPIALSNKGDIYVGGGYVDIVDFDPDSGIVIPSEWHSTDIYRMFIAVYNSNGEFMHMVEDTTSNPITSSYKLALSEDDNSIYSTGGRGGNFEVLFWKHSNCSSVSQSTQNLYTCDSTFLLIDSLLIHEDATIRYFTRNSAGCDSIVTFNMEFGSSEIIDSVTSCGPFRWIDSNDYYPPANVIIRDTNINGCDSVNRLVLLNPIDLKLDTSNSSLSTKFGPATYQWISCDSNGYTVLVGETDSVLTPPKSGYYALIISYNNCSDTTDCYYSQLTGLMSHSDLKLNVFPNPTSDLLHINSNSELDGVVIFTLQGQIVFEDLLLNDKSTQIDVSTFRSGLFILEARSKGKIVRSRFVRK